MDPITQGALGAALPQSILRHAKLGRIALCGAVAGMAPDLDVLITSDTDPLLYLVFHRQFTHALVFIPIGALIVAGCLYPLMRKVLEFKLVYLACLLGYATHGLLDACTSYGTQLFWPFTDYRVAWNVVSVLDPAFTVPLLIAVVAGLIWRRRWVAVAGLVWGGLYLTFGLVQSFTAIHAGAELAAARGHSPSRLTVKPTVANTLVWKVIYEYDATYYIDAVRVSPTTRHVEFCGDGARVARLDVAKDLPWLTESQQLTDIGRFSWFSDDYVAIDPAMPNRVIDIRYSVVPDDLTPLWGIELDPAARKEAHVRYVDMPSVSEPQRDRMATMLNGDRCVSMSEYTA